LQRTTWSSEPAAAAAFPWATVALTELAPAIRLNANRFPPASDTAMLFRYKGIKKIAPAHHRGFVRLLLIPILLMSSVDGLWFD